MHALQKNKVTIQRLCSWKACFFAHKTTGKMHKKLIKYDEYGKFDGTADAPVLVNGNSSVHFQTQFTYLGSVLDHMLSDIPDVKARVKKASG